MTIQQPAPRARQDKRSERVVDALVRQGLLAPDQRDDAAAIVHRSLVAETAAPTTPLRRRFAELAGYVGAAFVVSAAVIFAGTQWPRLSETQRVGLLVAAAAVLAVAGLALGRLGGGFPALRHGAEPNLRRLASVLFVGAAATAGGAVGVQVSRMADVGSAAPLLLGFAAFTALATVGYLLTPSVVGQVAIALGAFLLVPQVLDQLGDVDAVAFGVAVLLIGLLWLVLAERGLWHEVLPGRVIGCILTVVGAQIPVGDFEQRWIAYAALFAVAAAAFGMYVARRAWPYLATGVVAVTLAVPEALLDWTDDSLGPAGALLVAGVTLLVASLAGLRLRKEVSSTE